MNRLLLAAAIAVALSLGIGCKKSTQNTEVKGFHQTSSVALFGKNYNGYNHSKTTSKPSIVSRNKFQVTSESDFTSVTYEEITMPDVQFQSFINDLKNKVTGDVNNLSANAKILVLYLTDDVSSSDCNVIKGLSSFSTRADMDLDHQFYTINNGISSLNTNYYAICNSFSKVDLTALLNTTFTAELSQKPGILTVFKDENTALGNNSIKKLGTSLLNANAVYKKNGPNDECTKYGCSAGANICTYIDNSTNGPNGGPSGPSSYVCIKNVCKVTNINDSIQGVSPRLDEQAAYSFRDNFLLNYEIGQKYYSYYYYICYVASQFLRPKNVSLLDEYNFALSTYAVANTLQYGSNSEIVITTIYKNEAFEMIDSYKTITANTYYSQIMDDIKNDLSVYENKTRAEILAEIR
jgi:hypothetical protein